ncbi:Lactonase, 7-bladed beta-propeller-domain-containing protein [Pavlovales sp. CCMP2436]|nr:Lactonase, 7-bladed beta-propeller-domain-containing protein [Pavlovales sp. CCMP2436]
MAEIASLRVLASSTDAGTRWRTNGCRTGPLVLVGTGGGSDSVYAYRVAPDHASIMPVGIALKVGTNPSFIAQAKSGGVVYVASEGCVTAVAVEPHEPALRLLGDAQASEGAGTSHCSLDAGGLHVLAANYIGGSVCVLPIEEDGSVGAAIDSKHHAGAGTFLDRQEAAHPHSIRVDPWGGTWAFVPDLGLDTLFVYAYNSIQGVLAGTNSDTRHWRAPKGAGPRHIAFSPPPMKLRDRTAGVRLDV